MNQQLKVAVIGAGVMGEALVAALIAYGVNPELITISEKRAERVDELIAKYSISSADLKEKFLRARDEDDALYFVRSSDGTRLMAREKN